MVGVRCEAHDEGLWEGSNFGIGAIGRSQATIFWRKGSRSGVPVGTSTLGRQASWMRQGVVQRAPGGEDSLVAVPISGVI